MNVKRRGTICSFQGTICSFPKDGGKKTSILSCGKGAKRDTGRLAASESDNIKYRNQICMQSTMSITENIKIPQLRVLTHLRNSKKGYSV